MPVKRRAGKLRNVKITPEAVQLFKTARGAGDIYLSCLRNEGCFSAEPGRRHCDTCRAYLDARRELHRALDLRPWMPSPVDADDDEPPTWSAPGSAWSDEWDAVRELRKRLDEAVGGRV